MNFHVPTSIFVVVIAIFTFGQFKPVWDNFAQFPYRVFVVTSFRVSLPIFGSIGWKLTIFCLISLYQWKLLKRPFLSKKSGHGSARYCSTSENGPHTPPLRECVLLLQKWLDFLIIGRSFQLFLPPQWHWLLLSLTAGYKSTINIIIVVVVIIICSFLLPCLFSYYVSFLPIRFLIMFRFFVYTLTLNKFELWTISGADTVF